MNIYLIAGILLALLISLKKFGRFWFKIFKAVWIGLVVPVGATGITLGLILKKVYGLRELGPLGLVRLWKTVAREIYIRLKAVTYEELVGKKTDVQET